MRSGRFVRLWQDQLGPFPPYRLDNDALIVGYMLAAEFGVHAALGWGEPACALDAYVEFRHYVNDGSVKSGDREKGFFSIGGALRYFLEDEIDVAHKHDMRERILQGPPFTHQERRDILDYCEDDVRALARLLPHIVPTIRPPLAHAMFRAKFQWAIAQQERRGVPLDGALLARLRADGRASGSIWSPSSIARSASYEIVDGRPHWRKQLFADYVRRHRMSWLTHARRHARRDATKPSARWRASIRISSRCASCAIRCRSCGSTILRSGNDHRNRALALGLRHQDRRAMRLAHRSSCSARPNGFGS